MSKKTRSTKKKVGKVATAAKRGTADVKPDKVAKAPAKKQAEKDAKPKRISALDAAAQVLQKSGKSMTSKALIAAMAEQNLWKSAAGKTPHATLYAAMLREISAKGEKARFKKVDRGLFAFNAEGK